MKQLKQITNIEVIKPNHKEGTESLKTLHYEANQILFKYNNRYINNYIKSILLKDFSELGKKVKDLKVTDRAEPKKKEILQSLRDIYRALYSYNPPTDEKTNELYAQKALKFQVSTYLYRKEHGQLKTIKDTLALLDEMKEVVEQWGPKELPKSFTSLKAELLMKIDTYYDF